MSLAWMPLIRNLNSTAFPGCSQQGMVRVANPLEERPQFHDSPLPHKDQCRPHPLPLPRKGWREALKSHSDLTSLGIESSSHPKYNQKPRSGPYRLPYLFTGIFSTILSGSLAPAGLDCLHCTPGLLCWPPLTCSLNSLRPTPAPGQLVCSTSKAWRLRKYTLGSHLCSPPESRLFEYSVLVTVLSPTLNAVTITQ